MPLPRILCGRVAHPGRNWQQHRRDPDRRHRPAFAASLLRRRLRLHVDRRGAVRRERLSVRRAEAARLAAGSGRRQAPRDRRDRRGERSRDPRGAHSLGPPRHAVRLGPKLLRERGILMKRTVPFVITLIVGALLIVAAFIPHPVVAKWKEDFNVFFDILAAFAFILGGGNLARMHGKRVAARKPGSGWGYSVVCLAGFFGMLIAGLFK